MLEQVAEHLLMRIAGRETQRWLCPGAHEECRREEELLTQMLQGGPLERGRSAVPFELVQAVVSEQGQVEERQIRREILRVNLPERICLFELPDD